MYNEKELCISTYYTVLEINKIVYILVLKDHKDFK